MPQDMNPLLERPELSRDSYETPLSPGPPLFIETLKATEERISMINFEPSGWSSEEEKNLLKNVILLRETIHTGLYEQSTSSYNSPVFCVGKSNGKLRIVHDLQELNEVTIKDAGLPPNFHEFARSFSGRACYEIGDIMGVYDEREFDINTRPFTAFETPLGILQLTRLPQGLTNSVAVYHAHMTWILQEEILEHLGIFINDGGIKEPRSTYQHKTLKENSLIRRFDWEYAVILERILFRIEEAGLTISGSKFSCCVPAVDIVGHAVSLGGRKIPKQKINKIQNWPRPTAKKEAR
ncbi:hypothetical protein O181_014972 [Austropuccinia psidii MF-1]|uniref:Uncharacterized protein n=1 Tax=Austropuccinia psidii MF-1 TaxID=1389203 RepID=A0A9Q3GQC0_9BASI|nr:hypothetical protein [Austropuccinia psidii MF-1]